MYRTIDAAFWTDPKILKLGANDRYIFLYLITNPHSHVSGIYYLPMGAANNETGLTLASVNRSLDTLSAVGIVKRDLVSSVVWVVNMMAYQGGSPKLATNVGKHLHSLHGSQLVGLFLERYQAVRPYFDSHAIGGSKTRKSKISNSLRYQVLERDKYTCQYCGAKAPEVAMEVDHIVPDSAGGTTEISNLRASCWACNNGKSDRVSTFATPNRNRTGTEVGTETDKEGQSEADLPVETSKKFFTPPTLEEVTAYCQERKNRIDPETFLAHYEANGWVQGNGKKPIKKWKAAVITWEKNNFGGTNKPATVEDEYPKFMGRASQ